MFSFIDNSSINYYCSIILSNSQSLVEKIVVSEERTLESVLRYLVRSKSECLADYLHHSVKTNNIKTLVEILTAWSPEVIAQAKQIYEKGSILYISSSVYYKDSSPNIVHVSQLLLQNSFR